jgi:hypothetical protein
VARRLDCGAAALRLAAPSRPSAGTAHRQNLASLPDFERLGGPPLFIAAEGYIRNTPNCDGGIGALSVAENASISTRRVSPGVMMPSSHSRAVA